MGKNILIISHLFPPTSGIGGRRWAKFAKYLKRMGHDITVIAAENVTKEESAWNKDIEGIKVISLPYNFPKSIAFPKNDLFNKALYFFNLNLLKLLDKGNFFDRSIFWEKQINNEVARLISEKKIDCVIVTSGPFRLSNYVVKLKHKFPSIKFLVDFRDLWTEDVEISSFTSLPLDRKIVEKRYEKQTVLLADKVISVANDLNNYFSSLTIQKKFEVIPNGYDPEDFEGLDLTQKIAEDKIKFVFTGTLYINLGYIIEPFVKTLAALKISDPDLFNKLEFEFIGRFPEKYLSLVNENKVNEIFKFTGSLDLNGVYSRIANAHYCMLFLNDVYNFALSTKFCEYISQKKKIVVVSHKGAASEFIVKNQLGYWVDPENALVDLKSIILATLNEKAYHWDSAFDIRTFSIPHITNQLSDIIEEPLPVKNAINERNVLLTFDYELYLGKRSGTAKNCILKPTALLLNIFRENNFKKAIFFVDTTYLKKLTESNEAECKEDLRLIKNQLTEVLKDGHYIFPHLHPHWRDAVYDKKLDQWRLESAEYYRLHVIPEKERDELFSFSIDLINQLKKEAGVDYPVDSYRAGGWCLQPFSELRPHFEKYGLVNDFSALRGFKMQGKNIFYDFSKIPLQNIYSFSNEVEKTDVNGPFKEFVISTLNNSNRNRFLNRFLHKYMWYTNRRSFGDGFSAVDGEASVIRKIQNFDWETADKKEMVSVELMTYFTKKAYEDFVDENDFMHFISHPKMMSKHNVDTLGQFLKYAKGRYELNTDYKKMIN